MKRLSLNDGAWYLAGYPGLEWYIRNDHRNERLLGFIPARVPGTVQEDLLEQGMLPDVYRDMNSLQAEWVSGRNWLYKRFLEFDGALPGRRVRIRFEGVDYYATYFLNGVQLGESADMFAPVEFDITGHLKPEGRNILAVALDEAPREQCQIGRTSRVRTVKARFSYWWDFATRLIPSGIWDDVYLIADDGVSVDGDLRVHTDLAADFSTARVTVDGTVDSTRPVPLVCEAVVRLKGSVVGRAQCLLQAAAGKTAFSLSLDLASPELWQPNGSGDQPLYDVELTAGEGGSVLYRAAERFGVRWIERTSSEGFSPEARYRFVVNGKPVFIKGWNWVPIDMLYGRERTDVYRRLIRLAKAAHVNLLRVWGGGLIEKDIFYRLCDEAGIMVWQEFNQSSSGVDNSPPEEPEYIELFRRYALSAVKKRRNHASLAVWCGGNELMADGGLPLDTSTSPLLAMLSAVVGEHGNGAEFIPTSAFGPRSGLTAETLADGSELWDVHGPWLYQGIREQYALYNANRCAFHAEFGVEGAVPYRVLRGFLSGDRMWPPTRENRTWNHHGSWFIDLERLTAAFGGIDDMREYCTLGHYLQAEALRYAVESNRRRAPRCGGTLPWQFNEPFPNAVGTSAVAWSGEPKMAYYYVKKAYEPVHASLRYESQVFGDSLSFDVWLNASTVSSRPVVVTLGVFALSGKQLLERTWTVRGLEPEAGKFLESIGLPCSEACVLVRVRAGNGTMEDPATVTGESLWNEYLFVRGTDLSFLRRVPAARPEISAAGGKLRVHNPSDTAALFIRTGFDTADEYFCLLPGEERRFPLEADPLSPGTGPEWFNGDPSAADSSGEGYTR